MKALIRFPGIKAYQQQDKALFFGREEEARTAYYATKQNRVSLIYGQSGSGKSSLINCALIPDLLSDGADVSKLRVFQRTDDKSPFLKGETFRQDSSETDQFVLQFDSGRRFDERTFLLDIGARVPDEDPEFISTYGRLQSGNFRVLILDQFERIFDNRVLTENERLNLLEFLANVHQVKSTACHLVLVLRSEYVGQLAELLDYFYGVFDAPTLVRGISFETGVEIFLKTCSAKQKICSPLGEFLLDGPSFQISGETVKTIVNECRSNVDDTEINLPLMQIIGRSIVSEFVDPKGGENQEVHADQVTRNWIKKVKRENLNALLRKAFPRFLERRRARFVLEKMINASGKCDLVRRSEIHQHFRESNSGFASWILRLGDRSPLSQESFLDRLISSNLVNNETSFGDIRYEIAHDFFADLLHRKRESRNRTLRFFSTAFFVVVAAASLIYTPYLLVKVEDSRNEVRLIQKKASEEAARLQREQLALLERNEAIQQEIKESRIEAQSANEQANNENCRRAHRLFANNWDVGRWGRAEASLRSAIDACQNTNAISEDGIRLLQIFQSSMFVRPIEARTIQRQPTSSPVHFLKGDIVVTSYGRLKQLRPISGQVNRQEDYCDEAGGCEFESDGNEHLVTAGSENIFPSYFCKVMQASQDNSTAVQYFFSKNRCGQGIVELVDPSSVTFAGARVSSILWDDVRITVYATRSSGVIACLQGGDCLPIAGVDQSLANKVSALSIVSWPTYAPDGSAKEPRYRLMMGTREGEIFSYSLTRRNGSVQSSFVNSTNSQEREIRDLTMLDSNGMALLVSASDEQVVLVYDAASLRPVAVLAIDDEVEGAPSALTVENEAGHLFVRAITEEWEEVKWSAHDIAIKMIRTPSLKPRSVLVSTKSDTSTLLAGGIGMGSEEDQYRRANPKVFSLIGDSLVPCSMDRTLPEYLTVDRMTFLNRGNETVAAALYTGNTKLEGSIAIGALGESGCRFSSLIPRGADKIGPVHSIDSVTDKSFIASDFQGNVWFASNSQGTWELEARQPAFENQSETGSLQLTAIDFDSVTEQIFVGIRAETSDSDSSPCLLVFKSFDDISPQPTDRYCQSSPTETKRRIDFEFERRTLRWIDSDESGKRVAFSGDRLLAYADLANGNWATKELPTRSEIVWRTEFLGNGDVMVAATKEGTLEFWDLNLDEQLFTISVPTVETSTSVLLDLSADCNDSLSTCAVSVPLRNDFSVFLLELHDQ